MPALSMILGMIGTLFGSILGFRLEWGPILWGVIGAVADFLAGLVLRLIISSVHTHRQNADKTAGIIVVVQCGMSQAESIQDILWSNAAMGVSKLSL